ncbi:hypothetical protein ACWEN6_13625 [Sphaerisporangium sp. NPDC004334]
MSVAKKIQLAQRRSKAVQLRLAGVTYDKIATQLGYAGAGAASKDVTRALQAAAREQHENSEELLRLEIDRLDRLMAAVWANALSGDVKSIEAAERLISRRCVLLGLDLINRNGVADGDVASLLGTMLEQLQQRHSTAPALHAAAGVVDVEVLDAIEPGTAAR